MGLEKRVEQLESQFDTLDGAVRRLVNITAETHQIVLENQRENRLRFQQIDQRFEQQDKRFDQQDRKIDALTDATFAGFKRTDEKIDQLELLIRQILPNTNN